MNDTPPIDLQHLGLTPQQAAGLDAYIAHIVQQRLNASTAPVQDAPQVPTSDSRDASMEPEPAPPSPSPPPAPSREGSTTPRSGTPYPMEMDSDTNDSAPSKKRKNRASDTPATPANTPPLASASTKKPRAPTSAKKTRSSAVARPSEINRVTRNQWDEGTMRMKTALEVHVQVLYDTTDAAWIPPQPTPEALNEFAVRFGTEVTDVDVIRRINERSPDLIKLAHVQVSGSVIKHRNGRLARNTASIGEFNLRRLRQHFLPFGITKFAVDMSSDRSSLYNTAMEEIALRSFRQLVMGGAYSWLQVEDSARGNIDAQEKYYRHYIFHHLRNRWLREVKAPGTAELTKDKDTARKRRERRSANRESWLRRTGKPERYARIVAQTDATSDDDLSPDAPEVWHVRLRPERSKHANVLARRLDTLMRQAGHAQPGKLGSTPSTALPRIMPSFPKTTRFAQYPYQLPIDYFDVGWFNAQSDDTKLSVAIRRIAFPLNEAHILTTPPHPDELLSMTELNEKYGAQVLAKYNWPSGNGSARVNADEMDYEIGDD